MVCVHASISFILITVFHIVYSAGLGLIHDCRSLQPLGTQRVFV